MLFNGTVPSALDRAICERPCMDVGVSLYLKQV
jgi:hypothetical protein